MYLLFHVKLLSQFPGRSKEIVAIYLTRVIQNVMFIHTMCNKD